MMEKPQKIAMIYGYAVCLVAVITILIAVPNMVNAIIDLSDPIHADGYYGGGSSTELASYDVYKMNVLRGTKESDKSETPNYIPDEPTIKAMYEAARADKIAGAVHQVRKNIVVHSLLAVIALIFFFTHLRWMRTLSKTAQ
jgi:hypothetical protein